MIAFLTSRIGLAAVILAAAGIWIAVLTFQLNSCKANNADLAIKATAMSAQILEQNRAVDALAKAGREKAERAAQALAKAQKQARARSGEVKRLRSLLARKSPGKTCSDAWAEIRR